MKSICKNSLLLWICLFLATSQVCWCARSYEIVFPRVTRFWQPENDSIPVPADDFQGANSTSPQDPDARLLLLVVVKTRNTTFYLELSPVSDVIWSNLSSLGDSCLYRGEVITQPPGFATLSLCEGEEHMYGMWSSPDGHYILRPNDYVTKGGRASHTLLKLDVDSEGAKEGFCLSKRIPEGVRNGDASTNSSVPTPGEGDADGSPVTSSTDQGSVTSDVNYEENEVLSDRMWMGRRWRRAASSDAKKYYIQMAVFADKQLYKKFSNKYGNNAETELTKYILAVINEVQTIYKYRTMESNINIVIQKLDVLRDKESAPNTKGGEIDGYLNTFCEWQSQRKDRSWDHAIMITGTNLYKGKPSNNQVIGQAWVEGMCLPKYSCTLNEGDDFEAAFVIAHELGHNLGMVHDGDHNSCDPNKDLMSPSTGAGKTQWSSCSNASLKKFLRTSQAKCIENKAETKPSLNYNSPGLPGQRYDLSTQCRMALGGIYKSYTSMSPPFNNPCRQTWCLNPKTSIANTTHPALDGTSCGSGGKMCLQGRCVVKASSSKKNSGKSSKKGR